MITLKLKASSIVGKKKQKNCPIFSQSNTDLKAGISNAIQRKNASILLNN